MSGLSEKYGLGLRKFALFKDNGKKIIPGDVLYTLPGTTFPVNQRYLAFPYLFLDTNRGDKITVNLSRRVNHTTAVDSISVVSEDDGATWTLVEDELSGPFVSPPAPGGRIIRFRLVLETATVRVPYYFYSDDGVTFTDIIRLTNDYSDPGMLDGPTNGVVFQGRYYKALYGRPTGSGNRHIRIYSAPLDITSGEWTFVGAVSPIGGNDYEEPTLLVRPDNVLMCMMRSDTAGTSWISYSRDGGVTWSTPNISFPSVGKPPMAISPAGTVLAIGRRDPDTDWRSIYAYSSNGGKTFTTDYISESVNKHMYSELCWHNGRFIVAYCEDSNFPSGPSDLIIQEFLETDA